MRGGESPPPSSLQLLFSAPNGEGGGGVQPRGQHSPDRMLGKYLVSIREGHEEEGWGLAHTGFPVGLQLFFFPPFFPHFSGSRGPPPRRVTQVSAIRLLPGWGWQVPSLPSWAGLGRPPASGTCSAASLPPALRPSPPPRHVASCPLQLASLEEEGARSWVVHHQEGQCGGGRAGVPEAC